MILCEHFIYSLGTGLVASSKVERWLTEPELDYLCHLGDDAGSEKYYRTRITQEIVAVTYVKPIKDTYSRRDVWKHTVLIRYQDYFEDREPEPANLVSPHVLQPSSNLDKILEPIKL